MSADSVTITKEDNPIPGVSLQPAQARELAYKLLYMAQQLENGTPRRRLRGRIFIEQPPEAPVLPSAMWFLIRVKAVRFVVLRVLGHLRVLPKDAKALPRNRASLFFLSALSLRLSV